MAIPNHLISIKNKQYFLNPSKLKPFLFPFILLIYIIVMTALNINGSSVGMYNRILYGQGYKDENLIFGQPRPIRSDEWLVLTPWTLSQAYVDFNVQNDLYLGGQWFSIADVPVRSWIAVFEPQNWAFIVLPVENAFAFKWWFKSFLLAISTYFLVMKLSKNQILISSLAALAFVFSPFIQWWYSSSTSATETVSFSLLTLIFLIRIVDNLDQPTGRLTNAFFFVYFASCFAFTLYPPFQISLAIFVILASLGYLLSRQGNITGVKIRGLIIKITLCGLVLGIILIGYYFTNKPAIQAAMNTAYPGDRISTGGSQVFFLRNIAGFYNLQLLNDSHQLPKELGNQSEASSFFFFSYFLIPFYFFFLFRSIIRKEKTDLWLWLIIISQCILFVWGVFGLPPALANILFLKYVPPNRVTLSLGVINLVLIIYYLTRLSIKKTHSYKIILTLYSIGVFFVVFLLGQYLKVNSPSYINNNLTILIISSLAGIMMILILYQKRSLFIVIFLLFTLISTGSVNPLYHGLSPLHDDKLLKLIEMIDDPQAGWVTYDSILSRNLSNYLASNGIKVLNGTYYLPNISFWTLFDPDHKYVDLYNRYAHVSVNPSTDPDSIDFDLVRIDHIRLTISPCNPRLMESGVKYHIFQAPNNDFSCLSFIDKVVYPNVQYYIYEYVN
jgi:hypothetical protein